MAVPADAADLLEIRNFLGLNDITAFPDANLQEHTGAAEKRLLKDEIGESNDDYDLLRKYATGASLVSNGFANGDLGGIGGSNGSVAEERVADVMIKYGKTGSGSSQAGQKVLEDLPGGGYEHNYLRLLRDNYKDDLDYVVQSGVC